MSNADFDKLFEWPADTNPVVDQKESRLNMSAAPIISSAQTSAESSAGSAVNLEAAPSSLASTLHKAVGAQESTKSYISPGAIGVGTTNSGIREIASKDTKDTKTTCAASAATLSSPSTNSVVTSATSTNTTTPATPVSQSLPGSIASQTRVGAKVPLVGTMLPVVDFGHQSDAFATRIREMRNDGKTLDALSEFTFTCEMYARLSESELSLDRTIMYMRDIERDYNNRHQISRPLIRIERDDQDNCIRIRPADFVPAIPRETLDARLAGLRETCEPRSMREEEFQISFRDQLLLDVGFLPGGMPLSSFNTGKLACWRPILRARSVKENLTDHRYCDTHGYERFPHLQSLLSDARIHEWYSNYKKGMVNFDIHVINIWGDLYHIAVDIKLHESLAVHAHPMSISSRPDHLPMYTKKISSGKNESDLVSLL